MQKIGCEIDANIEYVTLRKCCCFALSQQERFPWVSPDRPFQNDCKKSNKDPSNNLAPPDLSDRVGSETLLGTSARALSSFLLSAKTSNSALDVVILPPRRSDHTGGRVGLLQLLLLAHVTKDGTLFRVSK